jgi:hypothetical protein
VNCVASERIAYHEAGHIVVAVRVGLGLRRASIYPVAEVLTDYRLNQRSGLCVDERVMFLVAGFFAEMRYEPTATNEANSADDFERAFELVGGSVNERLKSLLGRACDLVWLHWREVEVVAEALMARGTLSGGEIREIISRHT